MIKCEICGFEKEYSLVKHIKNVHGLTSREYSEIYPGSITNIPYGCTTKEYKEAHPEILSLGGKSMAAKYGCGFKVWTDRNPEAAHDRSVRAAEKAQSKGAYDRLKEWRLTHPEEVSRIASENRKRYIKNNPEASRSHYENTILRGIKEKSDWYISKNDVVVYKLNKWKEHNREEAIRIYGENALKNSKKRFNNRFSINSRFGSMILRSSYEVRYVELCELDDDIINLEYEPIRLSMSDGHTYTPDFRVTRRDHTVDIIEVKPEGLIDEITDLKLEAVTKYCQDRGYEFKIITESYLFGKV